MINACKTTPLDAICHGVHHHCCLLCLHELYIPVVAVAVAVAVVVVVVVDVDDDDDDDDDEVCSDLFILFCYHIFKSAGKIHLYPIDYTITNINEAQQGLNSSTKLIGSPRFSKSDRLK
jgi:hypothetical protein